MKPKRSKPILRFIKLLTEFLIVTSILGLLFVGFITLENRYNPREENKIAINKEGMLRMSKEVKLFKTLRMYSIEIGASNINVKESDQKFETTKSSTVYFKVYLAISVLLHLMSIILVLLLFRKIVINVLQKNTFQAANAKNLFKIGIILLIVNWLFPILHKLVLFISYSSFHELDSHSLYHSVNFIPDATTIFALFAIFLAIVITQGSKLEEENKLTI